MRFKTFSALVCCIFLVTACGQRGPLTMPKPADKNAQTHNTQQNATKQ
ncbi:LPS translocon maturation chaperone LptM [Catenovulum agarivorans]